MARRKKKRDNRIRGNTIEIDNPTYNPAHHGDRTNPQKIRAGFNRNEDPPMNMYARGHLNLAQSMAASDFRLFYETCGGAGARAIDYSKEYVDGGRFADPFNQKRADAFAELKRAHEALGANGYQLIEMFCGQRITIKDITAHEYRRPNKRLEQQVSGKIKGCLSRLAVLWGRSTPNIR